MGCGAGKYTAPQEIKTKWYNDFESKLPSLEGKVFCVTGCTTGTGFVCARAAARKGAHVVLLNRQSERAVAAEKSILEQAPGAKVTSVPCDLQSFDSVRAAVATLKEKFSETGIDVLCNNAGVMALADEATADGYDVQMQTNHISHFLLTKELFPLLELAGKLRGEARVVNHSSGARKFPSKKLDAAYLGKNGGSLGGNGNSMFMGGARWQRYHQTKLANAVFTLGMDDRVRAASSKVKCLCAAPGLAATNLQVTTHQQDGLSSTWFMKYAQSSEDGAMPLLHCCAGAGVESGDFWEPGGMANMTGLPKKFQLESICTNPESRKILWTLGCTLFFLISSVLVSGFGMDYMLRGVVNVDVILNLLWPRLTTPCSVWWFLHGGAAGV
ncbi:unnamed protein product [Polarella glacialis]|uniref:Protochlorophyllide reductase n=1 Tax=Polarella glacialis TaxID=89957 RepID=A0A813H6R9_POLGL|nr:unnamed protein product [Polarella glacialis]